MVRMETYTSPARVLRKGFMKRSALYSFES